MYTYMLKINIVLVMSLIVLFSLNVSIHLKFSIFFDQGPF